MTFSINNAERIGYLMKKIRLDPSSHHTKQFQLILFRSIFEGSANAFRRCVGESVRAGKEASNEVLTSLDFILNVIRVTKRF